MDQNHAPRRRPQLLPHPVRLEVDLLITTPSGVLGIEIKSSERLGATDWRALRDVGTALGTAWRGGVVVHPGSRIDRLDDRIWAVPVDRLLA
jgi:hypothetical protein